MSYLSSEMPLVYSVAPADWAVRVCVCYCSFVCKEEQIIQGDTQRMAHLAESAYMKADRENPIVMKQVLGFFVEGLRDRDIKMAMMMDEPQTPEGAYQKALSELKLKIRLDARAEFKKWANGDLPL